jgi:NAD(P)-dependent dehydrogenase (short-subunit alcohol dehydrogenase family)
MTNKILIITGGSRGIGAATARLAGQRGFDVALTYSSQQQLAEQVVADIKANGARAIAVRCDVSVEADVLALFTTVDQQLGAVDALVNNAAVAVSPGPVEGHRAADIETLLKVNVLGTILCTREAVKRMSRLHGGRGGAIVNLSSVAARLGGVGFATHYAASKGAIDSFTVGVAREVAGQGVRVNLVTPGVIGTDMNPVERREAMSKIIPAGRVGEPEEVAAAIVWLISDEASYVNAANIDVTGGR